MGTVAPKKAAAPLVSDKERDHCSLFIQNGPQRPAAGCAAILASKGQRFSFRRRLRPGTAPRLLRAYGCDRFGRRTGTQALFLICCVSGPSWQRRSGPARLFLGICLGARLLAQVAGGLVSAPSRHHREGRLPGGAARRGGAGPLFLGVPSPFVPFSSMTTAAASLVAQPGWRAPAPAQSRPVVWKGMSTVCSSIPKWSAPHSRPGALASRRLRIFLPPSWLGRPPSTQLPATYLPISFPLRQLPPALDIRVDYCKVLTSRRVRQ